MDSSWEHFFCLQYLGLILSLAWIKYLFSIQYLVSTMSPHTRRAALCSQCHVASLSPVMLASINVSQVPSPQHKAVSQLSELAKTNSAPPLLCSPALGGDLIGKTDKPGNAGTRLMLHLVPQIDPSVKLYNHGEGPY